MLLFEGFYFLNFYDFKGGWGMGIGMGARGCFIIASLIRLHASCQLERNISYYCLSKCTGINHGGCGLSGMALTYQYL